MYFVTYESILHHMYYVFYLFFVSWLPPLSTIFQLYHGGQSYWWGKLEYPEKPPTCRKSLTNCHMIVYTSP